MPGPLEGVRIIDLTTVLMGPYATVMFGDMGADVIKVEPPQGDLVRGLGPARHADMGPIFLHANRSKRSIVLDLKQPAGREALLRLAGTADVLFYNVRPQAMARLGLSYEDVAAVNPGIIYAGVFGYGQDGPYAARPAYDDLIQGAACLPTLYQLAGGHEPRYVPLTMADRVVGLTAFGNILGALYHRQRTGQGQRIDIPMFETMASFVLGDHMGGRSFEPPLGKPGYARLLAAARKPFRTSDGYVCVLIYNDKQWRSFFNAIGQPDKLDKDPRFADLASRTRHIDELYAEIAETIAGRSTEAWLQLLHEADIPAMPLHDLDSIFDDPHLNATGFFQTTEHPSEGTLRTMRYPSTWSQSQPGPTRPTPRCGEHSSEVLREAGYSEAEIARLRADKVTRDAGEAA
ncbi:MAG: CoA transferase [Ferrovibrio sp.]|uniref:CaiB/BaiF CoA transferase family protein n=1 Tax=Ferrovibrio sp. TaxID=1917215 RepID=UPI002609DF95|nr:CoA transferase [Ferrovibrio sp.]MCW0234713.1 CoA transferase [Ferrovibrio sp.]